MESKSKSHITGCAVAFGVNIFGDRWTLLILRDLILHGKRTFSAFRDSGEGIATNILTVRLKRLETEGIVIRSRDPENGKSYIYTLTEKGFGLTPVIFEILRWSAQHTELSPERRALLHKIDEDPEGFTAVLKAKAAVVT